MAADFPPPAEPQTFVELLGEKSRGAQDGVAFQERERNTWKTLTYGELRHQAAEIAAGLNALGVAPGDRVAIIMPNSVDWVCLFFGAVSAGAVAVPIYYGLKPGEVTTMLEHAEPVVAVVTGETYHAVDGYLDRLRAVVVVAARETVAAIRTGSTVDVVSVADLVARATTESREFVRGVTVKPDDLAAIIFTSGTSGGHKGVMLTHRNVMANVAQARRVIPFGPKDRVLLVLPMHHAFPFMIGLGLSPALGMQLTFENDLRRIRERLHETRTTLFIGVPALYELMLRGVLQNIEVQGRKKSFERALRIVSQVKRLTGLSIGRVLFRELHRRLGGKIKLMVSGGAALNPETQRAFLMLGFPIIQGWGLTEAGPALAVQKYSGWRFRFTRYYEKRAGSIGKALESVEIRLRDVPDKGVFVADGNEGELIARGPNITPGYWRSPELTEQIKDGEWLLTGDLGTIDREGNIRITGRSKFIIVLESGEKVYPDEVEEKLGRSPLVADIAVIGKDVRGKQQVCAVVYPDRDQTLRALDGLAPSAANVHEAVMAALREEERDVAAFKRIVDVELTDEPLPRTPLRKVMRGTLQQTHTFDPDRWALSWSQRSEAGDA